LLAADNYTCQQRAHSHRRNSQREADPVGFHSPQAHRRAPQQLKPKLNGYDHNFVINGGGVSLLLAIESR
jgi:hypothetical protein